MDVNNHKSELQKLEVYIKVNYKTQNDFAKAVGLTRQGLVYVTKTAKLNNGRLSQDFKNRLENRGINIFEKTSFEKENPEVFRAPVTVLEAKDQLIASQQTIIDLQKKLIENLQAQILSLSEQGKAGARRAV